MMKETESNTSDGKKEDVYESVKMKNDEKVMRAIINVKNVFNCVLVFFLFNLRLS